MRIRLREHRNAGFSVSQLSRWEQGRSNIPSKTLPVLADAYSCRVSEIFADDDQDDVMAEIVHSSFALDKVHRAMALRLINTLRDEQSFDGEEERLRRNE